MNRTESSRLGPEVGSPQSVESNPLNGLPTVTFEDITFSDGTNISLDPTDVVVLVGPNNAGKSVALQELEEHIGGALEKTVVKSVTLLRTGTSKDFLEYLNRQAQISTEGKLHVVSGPGFKFPASDSDLERLWPNNIRHFRSLFCVRIPTESRIKDSDPAKAIAFLNEVPSHPIHMLYSDDLLENRISQYFQRAFGEDLIVFRNGGSQIPLLTGNRPTFEKGEDRVSTSYAKRLRDSTVALHEQGDGMRSFASVILGLLAPTTPTVLLLDEPEAFLHPPQALLLGEIIAREKSSRAQLFVATHSPDVLHGLINVAPDHLRVLRMQRDGDVNRIRELDKELVKTISTDPLMKYSSVMSGVFHERVIICEADADCMFYSSILDLPAVHGERQPDVLFVHTNGKGRMGALAKTLVALDVPVDVVADMDILNDDTVFRSMIEVLGGDWTPIQPEAQAVKTAIEEHKPWLNADEIRKGIEEILEQAPSTGEFPKQLRSKIDTLFRKASPWDAVKNSGEAAMPSGQATVRFRKLRALCKEVGLWIVPVGELEGFCRSIGGHGPKWVQAVIGERDLASDSDLADARQFMGEIWTAKGVKEKTP